MSTKVCDKNPYSIVKSRCVTEKTALLENLKNADSNKSVRRCESPKYVFYVHMSANKPQIKKALEKIYEEQGITVVGVNSLITKPKRKGRARRRPGKTAHYKKAIVTLEPGDNLDNV